MLRRLVLQRTYIPIALECRRLSSDINPSALFSMLGSMWKREKGKLPVPEILEAVPNGTTRFWELNNPENQYVCIGGIGPIFFEDKVKISRMVDFKNEESNKLHIQLIECPTILASKIISAFPKLSIQRERLRIIKLSYHNYTDQSKGQIDSLIVANHICQKLNDEGEFGFYSGAAIKNANNEILFHNHKMLKTHNNEIHATFDSTNGYVHINNLAENDVGIVYTDCVMDTFDLRRWIDSND